jgi:P-type E1-E2 ATPase
VGDLVLFEGGDRVSADAELVVASALSIDTSTMTGESVPAQPGVGDTLFAGSFVVEGEGRAVVTATGIDTRLAAIAQLTQSGKRPRSPLAVELDRVVRIVAAIAVGVGVAFFAVALLIGTSATDGFLFAIGVTVALVPEGLLPTVTLSLAVGAQRMAARNALVRRLESVETLGSTTFICTDKTGTLTENRMNAVEAWTPEGAVTIDGSGYGPDASLAGPPEAVAAVTALAVAGARCSTGRAVLEDGEWVARGDPMEAALDALARRCGHDVAAEAAASPA